MLSQSTKLMYKDGFHSMSIAIWSVHDLSLRKLALWSQSLASTTVFSLSKMILLRIFPGTDRSIIPL